MAKKTIKIKRAYEPPEKSDGYRVLIDRLWPRGVSKARLRLDEWCKDLAPSAELRKFFGHDPDKWREFQSRYRKELREADSKKKLADLRALARRSTLTLVYSARDEDHNDAVVLKQLLERDLKSAG